MSTPDNTETILKDVTYITVDKEEFNRIVAERELHIKNSADHFHELMDKENIHYIIEDIRQNELSNLYIWLRFLFDYIRTDEYEDNHDWALCVLESLIKEYKEVVVLALNTKHGLDMMEFASKHYKKQTQGIMNLCIDYLKQASYLITGIKQLFDKQEFCRRDIENETQFAFHYFQIYQYYQSKSANPTDLESIINEIKMTHYDKKRVNFLISQFDLQELADNHLEKESDLEKLGKD